MTAMTFNLGPVDDTPENLRDHALGRADAYDAHRSGDDLTVLADRLEWMDDPRISHYSAAYLNGFRAALSDFSASQWWTAKSQTAIAYTQHPRPAAA